MTNRPTEPSDGLSLAPMRGLRPQVDAARLGHMLCPPYDVIDTAARDRLLAGDDGNAVTVILPEPNDAGYAHAAQVLDGWVSDGTYAVDEEPALYVYEMSDATGRATRGLLGAVELRAPEDGVILPHENTMAGPVADRLAVMTATDTDLEPIYLVYDGGGAASQAVRIVDAVEPIAQATTPDGLSHRLWALRDRQTIAAVDADLRGRKALIADGHHRYATYRERQRLCAEQDGAGPWDRGLALIVDSSDYGPQVHPIHRVVPQLTLQDAVAAVAAIADAEDAEQAPEQALAAIEGLAGFAAILTDGQRTVVLRDRDHALADLAVRSDEPAALAELDVTVVHRGLVERVWNLRDDVETVTYAHDVDEAIRGARASGGTALLLRATPVAAVAAVAAAGARMPRKSTLFTPKPASGLVMRRLADQP